MKKKRVYKFPINCPINSLKNYQVFNTEGATLKVYHIPGHTTDHVMLTLEEDKALFCADCVLGEGTSIFENLEDYLESLQLILKLNPVVMYPGHGSVINNTVQRVNNYIQHRIDREREIIKILSEHPLQTMTIKDFVDVIYKGISKKLQEVATISVVQHLLKLKKEGKVLEIDDHWKINKKSNL
ncbi:endoribonuclease LACTB2-like isoform X1 [Adelges cooleyi]|uniref:endoribonuclease LACTB2-like isoform X1 n=1 Tax=Adelges cooleyi TaxID=133065 RepID=UPI00217F2EE2|nr:endoribonuclease LACTB2-like isoform X1 [Adelges cooleyi]